MKFSKSDLDKLATALGAVGMVAGVLFANELGNPKITGSIAGICTGLTGYLVQKPADEHPTTEDLENKADG